MNNLQSSSNLRGRLAATLGSTEAIRVTLQGAQLSPHLQTWLNRLMLLHGVPINYLVPDEGMLPPESIRFFYVDMNWVDALLDGAFSIGRNLTAAGDSVSHNVDRAVSSAVRPALNQNAGAVRARAFGLQAPPASLQVVSGFMLRSSLVTDYPGISVNAYPQGGTPDLNNPEKTVFLPLLRFEQLGASSDTIICLVDGDAVQFDIHQPPEQLHYGIDSYSQTPKVTASKEVHTFKRDGDGKIHFAVNPSTTAADLSACFRTSSPRTLSMTQIKAAIATANDTANGPGASGEITSAEMGFEMTEGVGQVSFRRSS